MNTETLFESCEAVGKCDSPMDESGLHWFYWDCDRDTKRMNRIHGKNGKGHDDPEAAYSAVICKTCGRKALVLEDAEDFPEV